MTEFDMNTHRTYMAKTLLLCTFLSANTFASDISSSQDPIDAELTRFMAPAPSTLLADVTRDTFEGMRLSVSDRVDVAKRIASSVYQGDWSILASEAIHLTLCHLAGRTEVALFGARGPDFDEISLNKCADKLIDHIQQSVMRSLNRDHDHYGVVRGTGQIVDIYRNRTFLQMIVDGVLPQDMPLRGVLLSLAGNNMIERLINARVRSMALDTVRTLARNRGLTLREASGQLVVGAITRAVSSSEATPQSSASSSSQAPSEAMPQSSASSSSSSSYATSVEDETSTMSQRLFALIDPYLRHHTRSLVETLLEKGLRTAATQMDEKLRVIAITGASTAGAGTTYVAGSILTALGSFIPFFGPMISVAGAGMTSTAGMVAGGVTGKLMGDAIVVSAATNVAKRMDLVTRQISNQILDYTAEEHALYALNKNASQTERALFETDYALRDRLENTYTYSAVNTVRLLVTGQMTTLLGQVTDSVSGAALAPFNALCALFARNAGLDAATALERSGLDVYRNTHENIRRVRRESAYRHLMVAKHVKTPEGQELLENLKKFPSHAYRMGTHQPATAVSQDTLHREKTFAQDLEMLSWDLAANFGSARDYNSNCDRVLTMLVGLTPTQQDLLLEMKNEGFYSSDFDRFLESLERCTSVGDVLEATLEALNAFSAKKNAQYAEAHYHELQVLRDHSIAQNLTDADLVELHKKLEANPDVRGRVLASQTTMFPEDTLRTLTSYYHDIVGVQKGVILGDYYASQMRATGQAKALKDDARSIMVKGEQEMTRDNALAAIHGTGASFQKDVMDLIRPMRDAAAPYRAQTAETFNNKRLVFLGQLADEIVTEKPEGSSPSSTSGWLPFGRSTSSSTPVTPLAPTAPDESALHKALNVDALHLYDATLAGHFKLAQAINDDASFKERNLLELGEADLVSLTTHIMDSKVAHLTPEDSAFYTKHRHEVFRHLSGGESSVRDLLWFGLDRVIEEMRTQNARLLEQLFAQH